MGARGADRDLLLGELHRGALKRRCPGVVHSLTVASAARSGDRVSTFAEFKIANPSTVQAAWNQVQVIRAWNSADDEDEKLA